MQRFKGTIAAVLAAVVVLGSIGIAPAEARSRHHRNNAAAAAVAIGVIGTIAAIAAAESRRDRYYDDGYRYRGYRADGYRGYGYRGHPHYYSRQDNPIYHNPGLDR